jgi:hypothetical protein
MQTYIRTLLLAPFCLSLTQNLSLAEDKPPVKEIRPAQDVGDNKAEIDKEKPDKAEKAEKADQEEKAIKRDKDQKAEKEQREAEKEARERQKAEEKKMREMDKKAPEKPEKPDARMEDRMQKQERAMMEMRKAYEQALSAARASAEKGAPAHLEQMKAQMQKMQQQWQAQAEARKRMATEMLGDKKRPHRDALEAERREHLMQALRHLEAAKMRDLAAQVKRALHEGADVVSEKNHPERDWKRVLEDLAQQVRKLSEKVERLESKE